MPSSLRDQLLTPRPLPRERVELPELGEGCAVWVQAFTAERADRWETSLWRIKDGKSIRDISNFGAKLVIAACVDEEGVPIFTDADLPAITQQAGAIIHRIAVVAIRLCGLGPDEIKDAAKDFPTTPVTASPSDSPTS